MKNDVTLASFKEYIDEHVRENTDVAVVATTIFCDSLAPEEIQEALKYAAKEGITVEMLPDATEHEPDYNPQDEDKKHYGFHSVPLSPRVA